MRVTNIYTRAGTFLTVSTDIVTLIANIHDSDSEFVTMQTVEGGVALVRPEAIDFMFEEVV